MIKAFGYDNAQVGDLSSTKLGELLRAWLSNSVFLEWYQLDAIQRELRNRNDLEWELSRQLPH